MSRSRLFCFVAAMLCVSAFAQDKKEKSPPKKDAAATPEVETLFGGPKFDAAAVERGQKLFVPTCGFCHGADAHGKSGPDLVRSAVVLHDEKGNLIGQVVRNGRPERGMPAFASLSDAQMADLVVFLHSRTAAAVNRFGYKVSGLVTGNAKAGESFFHGEGKCSQCHSATGDLAHVATKYDPVTLQRRFLFPAPYWLDMMLGKDVKPAAPTTVDVTLASGEKVSGTVEHLDEFTVALRDSSGWYRSFDREQVRVEVHNPLAEHERMLAAYTDDEMHNMLAYLETLK